MGSESENRDATKDPIRDATWATPWLIGNWKLNGDLRRLQAYERALRTRFGAGAPEALLGLAVPDLLLAPAQGLMADLPLALGVQTCGPYLEGAHTGDTSAQMAARAGATFVLVGHSERRQNHREDDAQVRAQAEAAQAAGLLPLICVGETLDQRRSGRAQEVVLAQVAASCPASGRFALAYEPVWAIGTGEVASPAQAQAMHAAIRTHLADPTRRILYGGSMQPANAHALLSQPDIDGGLIGGASLEPQDLLAIYDARA